jgi:predicted nucleic acid-binding protein
LIIDASVAVKWLVVEEDSASAIALIGRPDLRAPTLIQAEVANAIWRKRRRGELHDDPELSTLPGRLSDIIALEDETSVISRALELALATHHPVYDFVYLALAEALDDVVLTADRRFLRALADHGLAARVEAFGA